MRHATRVETTVTITEPSGETPEGQYTPEPGAMATVVPTGLNPDSLSYWVKAAYFTMRREMENALRDQGLTLTQWRALGALFHEPGMTHSNLVRKLDVEAPSVTSLVSGLQRRGWIRQERSSSDARVKLLFLTPRGRRVIEGAGSACGPVLRRMEVCLPEAERASLKQLLRDVVEGLQHAVTPE